MTDVYNYAEETTFHVCDLDLKSLITRLEHDAAFAIEWFESNYMKKKYKYETLFVNVAEKKIWESK